MPEKCHIVFRRGLRKYGSFGAKNVLRASESKTSFIHYLRSISAHVWPEYSAFYHRWLRAGEDHSDVTLILLKQAESSFCPYYDENAVSPERIIIVEKLAFKVTDVERMCGANDYYIIRDTLGRFRMCAASPELMDPLPVQYKSMKDF